MNARKPHGNRASSPFGNLDFLLRGNRVAPVRAAGSCRKKIGPARKTIDIEVTDDSEEEFRRLDNDTLYNSYRGFSLERNSRTDNQLGPSASSRIPRSPTRRFKTWHKRQELEAPNFVRRPSDSADIRLKDPDVDESRGTKDEVGFDSPCPGRSSKAVTKSTIHETYSQYEDHEPCEEYLRELVSGDAEIDDTIEETGSAGKEPVVSDLSMSPSPSETYFDNYFDRMTFLLCNFGEFRASDMMCWNSNAHEDQEDVSENAPVEIALKPHECDDDVHDGASVDDDHDFDTFASDNESDVGWVQEQQPGGA